MRKTDLDPTLVEWMMAREVVRRLGFTPDEIYFEVYPSGLVAEGQLVVQHDGPILALELRRGDSSFHWTIGPTAMPVETIQGEYERACALWNSGSLDISHGDFISSRPARQAMQLMVALSDKGFTFREPAHARSQPHPRN